MSARVRAVSAVARVLVAVLSAALCFVGLQVPSAMAGTAVGYTVTLTSKTGSAIVGANVYAYPILSPGTIEVPDDSTWRTAVPVAGKPGQYRFDGAQMLDDASRYALYFDSPSSVTTAFDQFYGGTTFIEDARLVSPSPSNTRLAVSLATNATITGTVKNSAAKVIAGVRVIPWRWSGGEWFPVEASAVTTNSTGAYTMRNLEPGSYRLEFDAGTTGYLSEYSGNAAVFASAAGYFLALGSSVSVNADLATAGTLTGTVELRNLANQLVEARDIVAWAYPVGAGSAVDPSGPVYASDVTDRDGRWTITGLPSGIYIVRFEDLLNQYRTEWSVDKVSRSTATTHAVSLGKITTAAKTTLKEISRKPGSAPDTSLDLQFTYGSALLADADIYVTNSDGYFLYLSPHNDFSRDYRVEGEPGHYLIYSLDEGRYEVFVDPVDDTIAPYSTSVTVDDAPGTQNVHATLTSTTGLRFTSSASASTSATRLGSTYSVTPGTLSASATYSYQWMHRSGEDYEPITGATGSSYRSQASDVGAALVVVIRADKRGYNPTFQRLEVAAAVTAGAAPAALTPPRISAPPSPKPGQTLSAVAGDWSAGAEKPRFEYTWIRNPGTTGVVVGTSATYTLAPADAGQNIQLRLHVSAAGHVPDVEIEAGVVAVGFLAAPVVTKDLTISTDGSTFTASPPTWSPAGATASYTWTANGAPISGATSSTLVCDAVICPPSATIEVTVHAAKLGYSLGRKTYLARKGSVPSLSQPGTVATSTRPDTGLVGSQRVAYATTLLATAPTLTYVYKAGGTVTTRYQWQSSGDGVTWSSIPTATSAEYAVPSSLVGKRLRVLMTTTSSFARDHVATLPAGGVSIIAKTDLTDAAATMDPTVQSAGTYDATWRLSLAHPWPTAATVKYQWYKCDPRTGGTVCETAGALAPPWSPVSGATAATYRPTAALDGFGLAVKVTAAKAGYATAVALSGAYRVGGGATGRIMILGKPGVGGGKNGDAKVGTKLVATFAMADQPGATNSGRWESSNDGGVTWSPISGATSRTYLVSSFMAGSHLRFMQVTSKQSRRDEQASDPLRVVVNAQTPRKKPSATWNTKTNTGGVRVGSWPSPGANTYEYAWHSGGDTVVGTRSSFSTTSRDPIWVTLTVHRRGYVDQTYTFYVYKPVPALRTAAVVGSPAGEYGSTLDVDERAMFRVPVIPSSAQPKYTYQWYSGTKAIKGATGPTFTPSSNYVGKSIKVRVTISSPYFSTRTAFAAPLTLRAHSAALVARISAPDGMIAGARLTAAPTTDYPSSGTSFTYKWERVDGSVVTKLSSASSYIVQPADAGKGVRLTITASRPGWVTSTSTVRGTFAFGTIAPLVPVNLAPASGAASAGTTLVATAIWTTPGTTTTYAWYLNGKVVPGATGSSWTPPPNSWGATIQVEVTVSKPGYLTRRYPSNHVALELGPPAVPTTHPAVSGMTGAAGAPRVGDLLVATAGVWNLDGLTFSYVWKVGGAPVPGATAPTYQVAAGDEGQPISVEVHAGKRGWNEAVDAIPVSGGAPVAP